MTLVTEIALWTLAACALPAAAIDLLKFKRELRRSGGARMWWKYPRDRN
jgi:hypothetical protein